MREMRRKDRLVTDAATIEACLDESVVLHVGFCDEGEVYVLPVNFSYVMEDGNCVLYFHGAKEGRKADLAAKTPKVGFEMECRVETILADTSCQFSQAFLSIIGNGVCSIVECQDEKKLALSRLMLKTSGRDDWEFPEAMLNSTGIYKIEVDEMSCKEHKA